MNLMIDIETLGTQRASVICSVGFAAFDRKKIVASGMWSLDWQEQIAAGRTVDASTIQWWMQQDDNARADLIGGINLVTLEDLKTNLLKEYRGCETIWGNGPSFDLILLADLLGGPFWKFRQERDVRTIKDLANQLGMQYEFKGVAHNPEDDARNQAQFVIDVWERIGK